MPMHCDGDLEVLAQKQELLATSATGLLAGSPTAEELFTCAAGFRSKRVHYQQGLYKNPWQKDEAAVQAIAESFSRSRDTHVRLLKKRPLEERDEQPQEEATKPKAKARRADKSRAAPKRATRPAPQW